MSSKSKNRTVVHEWSTSSHRYRIIHEKIRLALDTYMIEVRETDSMGDPRWSLIGSFEYEDPSTREGLIFLLASAIFGLVGDHGTEKSNARFAVDELRNRTLSLENALEEACCIIEEAPLDIAQRATKLRGVLSNSMQEKKAQTDGEGLSYDEF